MMVSSDIDGIEWGYSTRLRESSKLDKIFAERGF